MRPAITRASVLGAMLLACGCALAAKKVPTPAAQLTSADLVQLPKPVDERYFVIFFGCNDFLHRPKTTHTWATLVRVRGNDCGPCGLTTAGCVDPALDVQTISWLPVSGVIDVDSRTVEPGRNYELHETMKFAADAKATTAYWGPYEVWHGFAHRFRVQKEFLDSGAVGYQCIDSRGEAALLGNGCDCIHSVTDMDPIYPRWRYPLALYGKPATNNLVRRFMLSPIWIEPRTTHEWLLPRLGLDAYKLEKRRYIGVSEEHEPDRPADLDARGLPIPVPGIDPKVKELPKTDPGKKPLDLLKKP